MVFGAPHAPNVMATAFLWLQCKFHNILGETKWLPRKLGHFMASGCSETHFWTFSMIWATFCTHQNHCYLCVLFSSQPQSTNFEQNLTRSLHFIGFTFEVGGAYSREKWSAFTRLKFQLDNLVIKGLSTLKSFTLYFLQKLSQNDI